MTSVRTPLPLRRSHEVLRFEHWSQTFLAGIGRAQPAGPILEVWLNTSKTGAQSETYARDAAVLISLGLQYGIPLSVMRRAVMRDLDGKASGPIGALIDLLDEDGSAIESAPRVPDNSGPAGAEPADQGRRVETV